MKKTAYVSVSSKGAHPSPPPRRANPGHLKYTHPNPHFCIGVSVKTTFGDNDASIQDMELKSEMKDVGKPHVQRTLKALF